MTSLDKFALISIFLVRNSSWISRMVWPLKGGAPSYRTVEEFIEHDPQTPDVHFKTVFLLDHDFGTHVLVGPANRSSNIEFHGPARPAEVAQFDIKVVVQQQVFRLDISVDDVMVMEIFNGLARLVKETHGQRLGQPLGRRNVEEEAPVHGALQQDIKVVFRLQAVDVLDDAGVVQGLVEADFDLQVVQVWFR